VTGPHLDAVGPAPATLSTGTGELRSTAATLAGLAGPVLRVLAAGQWSTSEDGRPPPLAGFVESSFSPLVAAVAERCLAAAHPTRPASTERGIRTAVIVCSPLGDIVSARRVARAVARRERVGPLMFFQSVPNAVAGHVAARWRLGGPVVCLGSAAAGVEVATLLLEDGDAHEALVVLAEQDAGAGTGDRAEAVLVVRRPGPAEPVPPPTGTTRRDDP
jgi:hypothetical protein